MNAAIRSVVRTALANDFQVYSCQRGYEGLVQEQIIPMNALSVANCIQRGGTILQTGRFPEFAQIETRAQAKAILKKLNINALVVLGGDGSFRGAALLEKETGIKTIGIPCTIDNDIIGTEYTVGFDTACNTALTAIDKIRDTALSANHHFIVEVMGRASGFLAVDVGLAGGAEFILIPEVELNLKELVERLKKRRRKLASIIVAAEANQSGRSMDLAHQIELLSGIKYRVCILGHTQRGGSPTVLDRKMATLMGEKAVEWLKQGVSRRMTAVQDNHLIAVDFPDVNAGVRQFTERELLQINDVICNI